MFSNKYKKGWKESNKHSSKEKELFFYALDHLHEEHSRRRQEKLTRKIKALMGESTYMDLGSLYIKVKDNGGVNVRIK